MFQMRSAMTRKSKPFCTRLAASFLSCLAFAAPVLAQEELRQLTVGNTVVHAKAKNLTLPTNFGVIHVNLGGQAFVMSTPDALSIYGLQDPNDGKLEIISDKKRIPFATGQQLLFTRSTGSFDKINPAKVIPYRHLTEHTLEDGTRVFSAEFSMLALIKAVKPLRSKLSAKTPAEWTEIKPVMKSGLILGESTAFGAFKTSMDASGKKKK